MAEIRRRQRRQLPEARTHQTDWHRAWLVGDTHPELQGNCPPESSQ